MMDKKSKGGRPPFAPTPAMRRRVSIAAGAGMTHEDIAIALGISRPTLEKHFGRELCELALKRRVDVLESMYGKAMEGNVAAQKAYVAAVPAIAAPPAEDPGKRESALGKKEQANEAAKTAQVGTEWGDLLPSKRLQ